MSKRYSLWEDPGPDGGFAWVVVAATFGVNLLACGFNKCQASLFIEIQKTVGVNRELASWPMTVFMLSVCFSAFFSGLITHYFGWRRILNVLLLTSLLGFVAAYVGPNTVPWICVYQAIIGMALGPVYPILLQIISSYFTKRRSMAQNMTISGFSMGSLLYPVLLDSTVSAFGLRGSWLILGAIVMHSLIFIPFMRPLTLQQFPVLILRRNRVLLGVETNTNGSGEEDPEEELDEGKREIEIKNKGVVYHRNTTTETNGISNVVEKLANGKPEAEDDIIEDSEELVTSSDVVTIQKFGRKSEKPQKTVEIGLKPKGRVSYISDIKELLSDPMFPIFMLTITMELTLYISSSFYLIDHGIDTGMTLATATLLVVVHSIGDCMGRIFIGWIIDKRLMGVLRFYALSCLSQAGMYAVIGVSTSKEVLFASCFLFGVNFCLTSGLRTLLTTNVYGVDKAATITGLMICLQGVFIISAPFLVGALRDGFGSYMYLFLLYAGLKLTVVCGALFMDIWQRRRRSATSNWQT